MTPELKLGLKPPNPDATKLKFGTYFNTANLPVPPVKFGSPWLIDGVTKKVAPWLMLGNDVVGDCVLAGAAHETMHFCSDAGAAIPRFDDLSVLSDYSAITGYNPADPKTDQGTDMEAAAKYRRQTGVIDADGVRHKVDVYAAIRPGDLNQLALVTYLFGICGIGVSITQGTMEQTNSGDVWDVSGDGKMLGGHYIPCIGRNSKGNFLFITWGKLQGATPAWVRRYMLAGIAYISRERLNAAGLSPEGYNASALNDDFVQVTS